MRELKVTDVDEALSTVFDDIESLARQCRFADCQHEAEPGCAVREAVARGDIDTRRIESYRKLMRESRRHGASLAQQRSEGRAFGKIVKQAMAMKAHSKGRSE
jgi:ribosome biogenesis GTPase